MFEQLGDRWATVNEIRMASEQINLDDDIIMGAGLPLLSDTKIMSVCNDDTHSIVIGGSGSKKNRLVIFPLIHLLAKNNENIFVFDPKGENLSRTGSFLKRQGYNIKIIDFRNMAQRGDYWNPFELAFKKYKNGDKDEAQEMFLDFLDAVAVSQKEHCTDRFWIDSALALGAGVLPLMAEISHSSEMNIGSFAQMISDMETLEGLAEKLPEDCCAAINMRGIITAPERTKSCIFSTLYSMISAFVNQKNLVTALSNSTFSLEEMLQRKTALFFITPDEKNIYNCVVSLMVKQLYQILIEKAQESEGSKLKYRVNFILDEFGNLPRISDFTSMISAGRSRNIRFFLVIQSLHQLQSKYGNDETQTIMGNCANWIYLNSRELPLLEMLSKLCGERCLSDGSTRPLITMSQLQHFNKEKGEALILSGRLYPYVTQLPDIDDYKAFRYYTEMLPPVSHPKEAKIIPFKKVLKDIEDDIRPIPFNNQKTSYVQKCRAFIDLWNKN